MSRTHARVCVGAHKALMYRDNNYIDYENGRTNVSRHFLSKVWVTSVSFTSDGYATTVYWNVCSVLFFGGSANLVDF